MKTHFFTSIRHKIHYYPFVQHHKKQFIMKYCKERKVLNQNIIKQWYTDIVEDEINQPIVLEGIEA